MEKRSWLKDHGMILLAGIVVGIAAVILQMCGNPKNMGVCIACFERDIAGALGFHSAAKVQYLRPEIIGIVLGALLSAVAAKEFRAKSGSSPASRFVLGLFVMIGALVFLGCPLRMVIRLGGCPLRQLILAGEGNGDSAVTVLGMVVGAAVAHNFGLAGGADSISESGAYVVGGIGTNGMIAVVLGFLVLAFITFIHLPKKEA